MVQKPEPLLSLPRELAVLCGLLWLETGCVFESEITYLWAAFENFNEYAFGNYTHI